MTFPRGRRFWQRALPGAQSAENFAGKDKEGIEVFPPQTPGGTTPTRELPDAAPVLLRGHWIAASHRTAWQSHGQYGAAPIEARRGGDGCWIQESHGRMIKG